MVKTPVCNQILDDQNSTAELRSHITSSICKNVFLTKKNRLASRRSTFAMPFTNGRKRNMDVLFRLQLTQKFADTFINDNFKDLDVVPSEVKQYAREAGQRFSSAIVNYRHTCIKQLYKRSYVIQRMAEGLLKTAEYASDRTAHLLGHESHKLGYEPFFDDVAYKSKRCSSDRAEQPPTADVNAAADKSDVPLPAGECSFDEAEEGAQPNVDVNDAAGSDNPTAVEAEQGAQKLPDVNAADTLGSAKPKVVVYPCDADCIKATDEEIKQYQDFLTECSNLEPKNIRKLLNAYVLCTNRTAYEGRDAEDLDPGRMYMHQVKHRNHPHACYIPDGSNVQQPCRSNEVLIRKLCVH